MNCDKWLYRKTWQTKKGTRKRDYIIDGNALQPDPSAIRCGGRIKISINSGCGRCDDFSGIAISYSCTNCKEYIGYRHKKFEKLVDDEQGLEEYMQRQLDLI